jgi:hypothetical protein
MQIKITVKQLGKKHPYLKEQPLEIADIGDSASLKDFLLAVVKQQVEAFNQRKSEKNVLPFLTEKSIQNQKDSGKVGFGDSYNDTKADLEKAQARMLEAFQDGLFAVFQGENQLEQLEEQVDFSLDLPFTFLRLAFLSGSYY